MNARTALLAAIGLAGIGLVALSLRTELDDPTSSGVGPGGLVQGQADAATDAERPQLLSDSRSDVRFEPPQPAAATAEPQARPAKGPRPGVRVRVVDEGGEPLGGVPVALLVNTSEAPMTVPVVRDTTSHEDGSAMLRFDLRGKPVPADLRFLAAIGLALDPRVERDLGATLPEDPASAEVVELVLPDAAKAWLAPQLVQVVDAQGLPVVGATVVFEHRARSLDSGRSSLGSAVTQAPDGIARLGREEQIEAGSRALLMQLQLVYEARCDGPFVPPPVVEVSATPSREPIRLVLPPTGSVVARLHRADGTPVEEGAIVALDFYPRGSGERAGYVRTAVEHGEVRFERVGLGLDLRLFGWLDDQSVEVAESARAGPLAAGETVEVVLVLGPRRPVLAGRLLDERGEPARDMRFSLTLDLHDPPRVNPVSGPRRVPSSYHATDGEGRFRIPWGGEVSLSGRFLSFEETPPRSGPPPGWVARFAQADFPALSRDGAFVELGDLTLAPTPILLAGQVVDAAGEPVRQAWLSLRYPAGEGSDETWFNLGFPHVPRLATDDQGRFEARSLQRVSALEVSASQNQRGVSEPLRVPPGTLDVRLVLLPGEDFGKTRGRVLGRLDVDQSIPLIALSAELHAPEGAHDTHPLAGAVAFENVLPGEYRFELRTMETDWLLDAVDEVEVRAGQTTRDPRLQTLDLRGRLRLLRLRLETEGGRPLASVRVRLRVDGKGGRLRSDERGQLSAVVRAEDPAFELSVEGFEPLEVAWAPDEQVLVLREE